LFCQNVHIHIGLDGHAVSDDIHLGAVDGPDEALAVAFPDEVGEDEVGDGLYYQTGAA
jgi:hypothetical protein